MKVLHFLFSYYPDSFGGTEIYASGLAKELRAQGVEPVLLAAGSASRNYLHEGIPVRRIAVFGQEDAAGIAAFAKALDRERPDIVHFHAFPRIGLALVREAKARAIPVLFTYHTPSVTCQRNTMQSWGAHPCDGVMRLKTCARCTLHGLGWSRPCAALAGSFAGPVSSWAARVGAWLVKRGVPGKITRQWRKAHRLVERHVSTQKMLAEVDHIVAVSEWVRQVLLRNGVPEKKLTLSRHGIAYRRASAPAASAPPGAALRIACLGRLDPMKGIDVLIRAVRSAPSLRLHLDIYALPYGETGQRYERTLKRLCAGDVRIAFRPPVSPQDTIPTLQGYDVLAVPSQCLETGPLVILEAFAAGIPVVGSRLGGIAELVRDGQNGILVTPANIASWRDALQRLHEEPSFLRQLRSGITPPKTMRDLSLEMLALYERLLHASAVETIQQQACPSTI